MTDASWDDTFSRIVLGHAAASPIGGRYSDLYVLSTGGQFSVVFAALDERTGKPVVLKFLKPGMDAYRTACFKREAEAAERVVGSRHVIQIAGARDTLSIELTHAATGLPLPFPCQYFALERAKGTFSGFLFAHARPRALFRRLEVMRDVVRGVNRLHTIGFCHRDLKPDNILIFPRGLAKVGDLGTCRLHSGIDPIALDYLYPPGDCNYAAPETFNGAGRDPALYIPGDWFGVGAILFEAITGQNLYVAIGLRGPDEILNALAIAPTLGEYTKRVSEIAGHYPVPSTMDFAGEPWLAHASNATHGVVTALLRDLCHFDYRRRLVNFDTILRRLDISISRARAESSYWRSQSRRIS